MNRSIIYFIISTTLLALTITSCSHEIDPFDGPSLVDRFGEFKVLEDLEVSQETVDFAAGETVFFTALFNKNVNWVVEITGLESGAVKRIEGFDSELVANNATWTGGTTDLPFFIAEMCSVKLLVPEEPSFIDSGEVEVITPKIYEGSLFTDFEEDLGSNIFVGNFEFEFTANTGRQNDIPSAEGEYYFRFEGTDNVVPNFFVGLVDIKSAVTGETYAPLPTTVPEDLYFNCFMYHDLSPYGIAVIQFATDTNDSGDYEEGQDETFQLPGDFPLAWDGWQHISHPMNEILEGSGNPITQAQLEKLVAIRILLISDMNSQPNPPLQVTFGIDYMTFTQGGPLEL